MEYTWQQASEQWKLDSAFKASFKSDLSYLKYIDLEFKDLKLTDINRKVIEIFIQKRLKEGVKTSSINRHLSLIRAILNKAKKEWEWLTKVPYIKLLPEPQGRIRWLTKPEANRLLAELPEHTALIARFSLATGLRKANVLGLQWSQIDLTRQVAWIHPDQAKTRRAIPVPLNREALIILHLQQGKHKTHVFTYQNQPVQEVTTAAWYKALKRAGIKDFKWHDLRHTWASWHVQAGTPLHILQELGGWESVEMVRRYAHLDATHLLQYANASLITQN